LSEAGHSAHQEDDDERGALRGGEERSDVDEVVVERGREDGGVEREAGEGDLVNGACNVVAPAQHVVDDLAATAAHAACARAREGSVPL
jgi:hypothetical protein